MILSQNLEVVRLPVVVPIEHLDHTTVHTILRVNYVISVCWVEWYYFTNHILSTKIHWKAVTIQKYLTLQVVLSCSVLDVVWALGLLTHRLRFFPGLSVRIRPGAEFTVSYNDKKQTEEWRECHLIGYPLRIHSFISLSNIFLPLIFFFHQF